MSRNGQKRRPPPFREPRKGRSALTEGLAVGALIHGRIYFVSAHQNSVQGAVVLVFAVMSALMHGALNALVGVTIHCFLLLLNEFGVSIAEREKGIQEKLSKHAEIKLPLRINNRCDWFKMTVFHIV